MNTQPQTIHAAQTATSTIKLWTPPGGSGTDIADSGPDRSIGALTLREVFTRFRQPVMEGDGASADTLADCLRALKRWEAFTQSDRQDGLGSDGNYLVDNIGQEVIDQFRSAVADAVEAGDYSAATVNKWFRYLRSILNHLGPKTRQNRRALKWWDEVPFLEALPEDDPDPVELTADELDRLYRACDVAEWPPMCKPTGGKVKAIAGTGIAPATWWRVMLVLEINCGPRRDDWLYLKASTIDRRGDFPRLTWTAKKTKKTHCHAIHPVLLAHLDKLPQDREYLFRPTQGHRQLYRTWQDIQAAAKVARPDGKPYGFHALRQTAAARFNERYPGTAELLLGHSLPRGKQVTAKHYLGRQLLAPLWAAQRAIEQPLAFTEVIESRKTGS